MNDTQPLNYKNKKQTFDESENLENTRSIWNVIEKKRKT